MQDHIYLDLSSILPRHQARIPGREARTQLLPAVLVLIIQSLMSIVSELIEAYLPYHLIMVP